MFAANESDVISNDNALEALLQYHVAQGVLPSTSFGLPPQFPATLLSNANYTNVTGGQRVEITSENGAPTILTGVKAASHVVQPVSAKSAFRRKRGAEVLRTFSTLVA